ncbi:MULTISPECIES: hypothetical protein [unclassified Synechococcus]|uniref:hypothetical protein n=2 Tax=unclassified Synechococcus TaxID=2626047 RepID=UPI0020CD1F06|nr:MULTISPECIES: hypothetical protein [unclassified Synechococcus]
MAEEHVGSTARGKTNGMTQRLHRLSTLVAAVLTLSGALASGLGSPLPAAASLLGPVLRLMRPQLERKLSDVCVSTAAGGQASLERSLKEPCRRLAAPASACLISEAESSGRSFGVISELARGRLGDDSEVVVKRCVAKLLGLPADSLKEVSLDDLQRRFKRPVTLP